MYKYLTKNGKTSITGGSVLANKVKSDAKPTAQNNKMRQYIEDHQRVYDGQEATKSDAEAAAKRIDSYKSPMSYQDLYTTSSNKKSPK